MELTDIRKEIDAIDEEMVRLFARRMLAADAVADSKRGSGKLGVLSVGPARETTLRINI